MLKKFYTTLLFVYTKQILAMLFLLVGLLGYFATKLEIDASSNTLLLDNDKDLLFTQTINKRYGNPDILVITYTPNQPLLSDTSLENLESLSLSLENINTVQSVTSILTVPLLQSPPQTIQSLLNDVPTLKTHTIDKQLAQQEFLTSPLYKENLVSQDFKTTALLLHLTPDKKLESLKEKNQNANNPDITRQLKQHRDQQRQINKKTIQTIRTIISSHEKEAQIFLGGVNMISNDVIEYIQSDLIIYGTVLILLFTLILWIFFKAKRWVILPLFIALVSVIGTTGILGLLSLEVTVISSNFISLQLIITLSLVIHLIIRYQELFKRYSKSSQKRLVLNTVLSKFNPSFFAVLTTIVGFSSLIISNIKPIIHLGFMMSLGIVFSLILTFVLFPALLILLKKPSPIKHSSRKKTSWTNRTASWVEHKSSWIITTTFIACLFGLIGSFKLMVENSFIDYFKSHTPIYQGMKTIDQKLGGTTPLDLIVTFKDPQESLYYDTYEEVDEFDDEFDDTNEEEAYWFTPKKIELIQTIHRYLEQHNAIGYVASLDSLLRVGQTLNHNQPLDSLTLSLFYQNLPSEYKRLILDPYVNIEHNQIRFTMRIIDSDPTLRRNELIQTLNKDLQRLIDPSIAHYRLSNLMILYNNMLQTLFDSQILTLGLVAIILFFMFLLLFRSLFVAFIALFTNMVPISIIFGIMGWFAIPLDLMTITIAAISIGMGVDDTIHYIHRYKQEFEKDQEPIDAMKRTHNSMGYAMIYTSLTVMIGFSILVFSNFIPTLYFGLLTVLVMFFVLLCALLLLPKLLVWYYYIQQKWYQSYYSLPS